MNLRSTLLGGLLLLALGACSKEHNAPKSTAKPYNPLSAQTEALDKARQLESKIQDAAQQQRQRIDERTR
ncbi:MAG: hypothetical protein WBQ37_05655 [Candidatus Competibacter sp.]